MRHFDPTMMIVTVRGDRLEVQPLQDAILALSEQTKRDWWQMVVPPERLSGEDVTA